MASGSAGQQLTPCPRCGFVEDVLSVPAAYHYADAVDGARRMAADNDSTIAQRRAARATIASAPPVVPARQLAMAPNPSPGGIGCLAVVAAVAGTGLLIAYRYNNGSAAWLLLVLALLAGLGCLLLITRIPPALARSRRVAAGRAGAAVVWHRGWYCCRCAVVFFQAAETPPGVAVGQPLTPAEFQHVVWTAGGYVN